MDNSQNNSQTKNLLILAVVIMLGVVAWGVLTMPDQRSAGQKIGDAVKDAGDDIKKTRPTKLYCR